MTLYCITHKAVDPLSRWAVAPIAVGAWVPPEGHLTDKPGDNISAKNPHWCELTAQYWLWRNVLTREPIDRINGFCHYRRLFMPPSAGLPARSVASAFPGFAQEALVGPLVEDRCDVLLPEPMPLVHDRDWRMTLKRARAAWQAPRWGGSVWRNWSEATVYSHYAEMHFIEDLMEAIADLPPEIARPFREHVMTARDLCPYNMFIARNEVIVTYFELLFSWLERVERRVHGKLGRYDRLQTRLLGFLSERFCSFYFRTQRQPAYLPVCFITDV
ncbi:MAG: DUF4422 domain-containing protein [Burkholderiales bacterium]|nr:DUF4422 domain-containing protein [Burkholderiales bacterium]MCH2222093.1 DUF4422 domain-containing protein [Dechloromonas sp.]MCH2240795.1 DUF4422 domain-containing protein [Aquabacterium sp.]